MPGQSGKIYCSMENNVEVQRELPVILMIIGGLGAGGKEQQLITLLKGIRERNTYSVILATLNKDGFREAEAAQFAEKVMLVKRYFNLDFITPLVHLIKLSRKNRVRLIHTWGSGFWDLLGLILARILHIPLLHGGIRSAPSKLDFPNRLCKFSAGYADVIVANSKAGLLAFGVADHPKASVIYNGLDLSRFEGLETNNPEKHSLCMVANFSDKKDHHSLIMAMRSILGVFPDAHLTLVGHDAGTLAISQKLAVDLSLSDHIDFVTDCLNPAPLIARSEICILATHGEGLSNVLLEYMALSKPVILSNNGGNPEVIEGGSNGFLVTPQSPDAISEKVIDLFSQPDLARTIGKNGYETVVNKFSFESLINKHILLYSDLIL